MLKPLILWGAGGHAKVLREFAGKLGYRIVAIFDNDPQIPPPFSDVPLFYGEERFMEWRARFRGDRVTGAVAIGGGRGLDRLSRLKFFQANDIDLISVVHPSAFVSDNAKFGFGCQVLAKATVGVEVSTGNACIINTGAIVDHECVLGDGVHLAPGSTLAGCVKVGDFSFVACGATILPRINIGAHSIIGAGAVVTRDVPAGVIAYGSPARIIRAIAKAPAPPHPQ